MLYEIIDKVTEEITEVVPFESDTNNDTASFKRADGSLVVFSNPNGDGQLVNDQYVLRQKENHVKADGTGTVEITEAGIVDSEAVVAEAPVTTEEVVAETTTETVAEEVAPTVAE